VGLVGQILLYDIGPTLELRLVKIVHFISLCLSASANYSLRFGERNSSEVSAVTVTTAFVNHKSIKLESIPNYNYGLNSTESQHSADECAKVW
jgi:hypothetical protein